MTTLAELLAILRAEQLDNTLFRGGCLDLPLPRVYGGQVLAQALFAAASTVEETRPAHSMHGYFLRPGNFSRPILYHVDKIRDGGSFTTRRVVAKQDGKAIFNCSLSFHGDEAGPEHQLSHSWPNGETRDPPDVEHGSGNGPPHLFSAELADIRVADPSGSDYSERAARQFSFWLKTCPLGDAMLDHQMLLALFSDYGMATASLLRHGPRAKHMRASLDHAIWFHNATRADEWHYYSIESPRARGGRGFCRGEFFNRAGELVCSTAQEVLQRRVQPEH